ncbi:LacI family DNA-binding transcriptional regulator [Clostridium sp. YIM B02500]|uniref:LacI family DNA-binding transcriptional regulator n=1 Tax=Clostridium sp. YIM B02500 TaxID=2910681 RepID=UPI001EEE11C5|nr:LacI family DNA-binding transcriptional regulator [Clostridium sp. YIM B02500]
MKVTIKEVAERANVSKSTVSQFLNERFEYMSDDTKKKIEIAIEELDYQPNQLARSLKQKRTNVIGIVASTIRSRFTIEIVRAVEDVCQKKGIQVLICNTDDNPEKEKYCVDSMISRQVDGLIVFPTRHNIELYQNIVSRNYPLVLIDRRIKEINASTVVLDNLLASKKAVDLLVENGHKKIGILSFPVQNNSISNRVDRIKGYRNALRSHGISVNKNFIKSGPLDKISGMIQSLLNGKDKPTAVIASNDMILEKLLIYVKENGISIPDELSVIGIDDVSFASFYQPSITTIAQPAYDMGKECAKLLFDQIEYNNGNLTSNNICNIKFEPILLERESVSDLLGELK